jgi:DNA (cytosine-5)-methyltransferase 1
VEEEVRAELSVFIDLTLDDENTPEPRGTNLRQLRNSSPQRNIIPEVHYNRVILRPETFVQIKQAAEDEYLGYTRNKECRLPKIDFIRVRSITQDSTGRISLRGIPYTRIKRLKDMFGEINSMLNEVCPLYEIDEDDPRDPEIQAAIVIPIDWTIRARHLTVTNAPFPEFSCDVANYKSVDDAKHNGPLVCRWKCEILYRDAKARESGRKAGQSIFRYLPNEVKPRFRVSEAETRDKWRGVPTVKGGSYIPNGASDPPYQDNQTLPGQQYTVFDAFCGGGGVSRGAQRAGFRVTHAVDVWDAACNTHRANFPQAELFQMSIDQFLIFTENRTIRPDILHLSPPCQYWSPAHTIAGKNDDQNRAALFSCDDLTVKLRPRFFTLEQTFGILHFRRYFKRLLGFFIKHGYSLRWKVVFLATWGLPQRRQRLVIIGAGPGEILPPWPKETHSVDGADGLLPYITINQALARISPRQTSTHSPKSPTRFQKRAYDGNTILPRAMTVNGGQNYHPSGERDFTLQEYAVLQGFPSTHQFVAPYIKKQIGNAFPPCTVQVIYEQLRNSILKQDGLKPFTVKQAVTIAAENDSFMDLTKDDDCLAGTGEARAPMHPKPMVILIPDDGDLNVEPIDRVMTASLHTVLSRQYRPIVIPDDDDEMDIDESDADSETVLGDPFIDVDML